MFEPMEGKKNILQNYCHRETGTPLFPQITSPPNDKQEVKQPSSCKRRLKYKSLANDPSENLKMQNRFWHVLGLLCKINI